MATVLKECVQYPSHDGKTTIRATIWYPSDSDDRAHPRGVIQLVHGMSEYIDRYDDFARFLNDNGFVVCGNDHVGHGRSVSDYHPTEEELQSFKNPQSSTEWGHLDINLNHDIWINDVLTLTDIMQEAYKDVPYYLFGHSLGSFIARAIAARCGDRFSGVIICGTGNNSPALCKTGYLMAKTSASRNGDRHVSQRLRGMVEGQYAKSIPGAVTECDWLNTDPLQVGKYIMDPACGFPFTVGAYAALFSLSDEVATPKLVAGIPNDLPLMYISGAEDPVGAQGSGVQEAAELARNAGVKRIAVKICPTMRHEILHEPLHNIVYEDVVLWIKALEDRAQLEGRKL